MALLGNGALVIWHDVRDETGCNEWHSREHMIERVAVPGFRRGLRYVAVAGSPKYMNLYEVDDLVTPTLRRRQAIARVYCQVILCQQSRVNSPAWRSRQCRIELQR
jgi:hypothetical protein